MKGLCGFIAVTLFHHLRHHSINFILKSELEEISHLSLKYKSKMEFTELPIYKVKEEQTSNFGSEIYCRGCKKTEDSSELFRFRSCEGWIQDIFETLSGFSVSSRLKFQNNFKPLNKHFLHSFLMKKRSTKKQFVTSAS
jgi:hypothetical protein